ncbi:hypothetical protein OSB04_015534, partial [Centaurea solstitialis]
MPTVWFSLKKSLHCKSDSSDVHDPKSKKQLPTISTRRPGRSGCSRSIANLKDVIHGGSKRHSEKPVSCSPRSIGSSEFINPITHEVILSDSRCELKITGFGAGIHDSGAGGGGALPPEVSRTIRGNWVFLIWCWIGNGIGNSGHGGNGKNGIELELGKRVVGVVWRQKLMGLLVVVVVVVVVQSHAISVGSSLGSGKILKPIIYLSMLIESLCLLSGGVLDFKCYNAYGGRFIKKDRRNNCRSSWLKSENNSVRIEKVLKVHNMQKTLARFEEYRESVKTKASKLPKKHPRCLADGNELLRFYGTTIACSLGINGDSSLCISDKCCVCRIIRNGNSRAELAFSQLRTSARAFESIEVYDDGPDTRRALIVCRVIAGRVHRPLENIQEITGQSGLIRWREKWPQSSSSMLCSDMQTLVTKLDGFLLVKLLLR